MTSSYRKVYEEWKQDLSGFWASAAETIDWFKEWTTVFDADAGTYGR